MRFSRGTEAPQNNTLYCFPKELTFKNTLKLNELKALTKVCACGVFFAVSSSSGKVMEFSTA